MPTDVFGHLKMPHAWQFLSVIIPIGLFNLITTLCARRRKNRDWRSPGFHTRADVSSNAFPRCSSAGWSVAEADVDLIVDTQSSTPLAGDCTASTIRVQYGQGVQTKCRDTMAGLGVEPANPADWSTAWVSDHLAGEDSHWRPRTR